jgi:signal transduction histidine kinase/CheY-like chemotaxis protein/integral membrane sensor domain MASE1
MLRTQHRSLSAQIVKSVFAYPLLTVVYTLSGKLGLMLAVPPGYASPIFPAAGIAVTAALIRGRATLPWIFLGSLLLNLWAGYSINRELGATCAAAAIVIAAASMLQAAVGGAILRRAIGYPAPLDNGRDLARFLLLSPVCCLTSASLSLAGLLVLGVVARPDLATSWISWWIGDTLGVLVVLPLMLVVAGEPRALWRSRALPVAVPMLLFCALFAAIFVRVSKWENDDGLLDFRLLSRQVVDEIHTGLEEDDVFLEQLERSFTGPASLSRSDFHHLAQNLLLRVPAIQAVKWAPRINPAQRAAYEAAQQAALPGFEIREVDTLGHLHRAGARAHYYPVTYVEPVAGNQPALGFDLESERDRAAATEAAVETGTVAATAPIRVAEKNERQTEMLLIFAVHDGPNGPGVLIVALQVGTFMKELLAPVNTMIDVRFVDLDGKLPLFVSFPSIPGATSYDERFNFGGRRYDVQTAPTASYLERHRRWQSWGVLVVGVFSTGLLGALLMLGTGYTRRIERVVDQRMRDLEATNRRLQIEVKEREQAEAALRQAQRMEAIGQLTGGIAHDFNNLLTVVSGNAELLCDNAPNDAVLRRASAVVRAAERGKRLTRQLLAFSRRQNLRPEPVDLRQRTREIADMLSRSLRTDIEVTVDMPEQLWPVAIDPAEFELALLNVGVNARDAMPEGGRFRVSANNVAYRPGDLGSDGLTGDFVAVTLSDTGIGMSSDVLARAFEPYFTTKEAGLGSGLGLSQVYGFAKQSGGTASIESTPGQGTSVKLLLPRATATAGLPIAPSEAESAAAAETASAHILFVEDDAEVAEVTAELLQDIGHRAVEARDGDGALAALERDPTIELVLSDIVMPGRMSGLELARILRKRRPELPVLLATGYSQYVSPAAAEGFVLVEKPYRRDVLGGLIRKALERSRRERIG